MSNGFPLPFPYVPGEEPVGDREFQERVQQNFDKLASGLGQQAQYSAWVAPTLTNSWVDYGGGEVPTGYFRDGSGIVHLRGLVKNGTGGTSIFTLPAGFRPAYRLRFVVHGTASVYGEVHVLTDGTVLQQTGGNGDLALDGITFRAEQ